MVLVAAKAGEKWLSSVLLLVIATCLGLLLVCELSHEVTLGSLAGQ